MKSSILLIIVILLSFIGNGQENIKKKGSSMKMSMEGMIGFSVGKDFYSINVGGPALFLNVNKDLKVGLGALPSLYSSNGKFGPRLAMSPRVDYKNLVFMAPFFPGSSFGTWMGSIGLGYKFQKRMK
jgi:uncharacterized membrane protein YfcA